MKGVLILLIAIRVVLCIGEFDMSENVEEKKDGEGDSSDTCPGRCEVLEGIIAIDVDDIEDKSFLRIVEDFRKSKTRTIVLDYDGTLTEIVKFSWMAAPTEEIKNLLLDLNKVCRLVICTGRSMKDSDAFFPKEIEVFAEHAACHRVDGEWTKTISTFPQMKSALELAESFTKKVPGSELSIKATGFTFHYRNAHSFSHGKEQADVLFEDLKKICEDRVKKGKCIVEVTSSDKSLAMNTVEEEGFALCAGDDLGDEAMFSACKDYTIRIGQPEGPTAAKYMIKDPKSLKKLLRELLK